MTHNQCPQPEGEAELAAAGGGARKLYHVTLSRSTSIRGVSMLCKSDGSDVHRVSTEFVQSSSASISQIAPTTPPIMASTIEQTGAPTTIINIPPNTGIPHCGCPAASGGDDPTE